MLNGLIQICRVIVGVSGKWLDPDILGYCGSIRLYYIIIKLQINSTISGRDAKQSCYIGKASHFTLIHHHCYCH